MNTPAIDIHSCPIRWPQFDPDRPVTPYEALYDGDEHLAERFVEWLASEPQHERLYHLIIRRLDDEDVRAEARAWADQLGREE